MITIISSGIYSTIQDQGRFGYRKYGVPVSGPMDPISANNANAFLKNPSTCATLEFMLQGPILKFNQATIIAISGAANSSTLNDVLIQPNTPIKIKPGDLLKTGRCDLGMFGYLSILGGFLGEEVLGSRAYYKGITPQPRIKKGDQLFFKSHSNVKFTGDSTPTLIDLTTTKIPAYKGPDFDQLDSETVEKLQDTTFTVSSEINRMGYRIDANLNLKAAEIITAPVQPGTVQLTPSGKIIALMADCQTTGGYARILQLPITSRSILAQKRTGEIFTFKIKNELSFNN
jgi:biotin-dependent carboxylase-like uncharacterized protein